VCVVQSEGNVTYCDVFEVQDEGNVEYSVVCVKYRMSELLCTVMCV